MTEFLPINLTGNNLGQRHMQLNSLVNNAFQLSVPFQDVQLIPEVSPVDRLFKIDLASKYKNVDYIIKYLKDPDMLFVSRALKCTWLLEAEYMHIINANYLEDELFPEMTSTAACKMLHWIKHHLRDPERCKYFYKYYKEKQFKIAIKFLWHCSKAYVLEEFKSIVHIIDAFDLKVLSEKLPQLTKLFYKNMEQNQTMLKSYLDNERYFFGNIKYLLKSDPDTFFYVIEKYFNVNKFNDFGSDITKHIMLNHRNKFLCKPELYTLWLLDINTLAKHLSQEESKEIVLILAKAEYMANWFSYQKVEPLIKRLGEDERATFKKFVFVDKAFGDMVKNWPYTPPSSPIMKEIPGYGIFLDKEYGVIIKRKTVKRMIKKRKGERCEILSCQRITKRKTPLDDLFDRYRFMGFNATLTELRKRIKTEGNMQLREYIILVLVSKSGGREDNLRTLLELLSQYKNEPTNFRAAIVRSLVKRAFVWRLPDDLWYNLLQWAHGMGLDGAPSEIDCTEGLHAVVLRNILRNQMFDQVVSKMFFDNFTYFTDYSLTATERSLLRTRLPNLLLAAAVSETGSEKETRLGQLLNVLDGYKIPFDRFSGVIDAIATGVRENPGSFDCLLIRLYNARVARKQFFKELFSLVQDNASYMNALRHDISVIDIDTDDKFKEIVDNGYLSSFKLYFRKLVTYFVEAGGLAEQFYTFLKRLAETSPHKCIGKPLCQLAGEKDNLVLKIFSNPPKKSAEASLVAALKANLHLARPQRELNVSNWRTVGVKAVANLIYMSPRRKREEFVTDLITCGRRTLRLALVLTEKTDAKCAAYKKLAELRPGTALKMFLCYLKGEKFGNEFETIWNIVKPLITELNYDKRERLFKNLEDVKSVPTSIKPEYYILVHQAFLKTDKYAANRMLCRMESILCEEINKEYFSFVVKDIIMVDLLKDDDDDYFHRELLCLYVRLIAKFLLLSDSEETQRERLNCLEVNFFQRFGVWWKGTMDKNILTTLLEAFLEALKYNKVFFNVKYVSCMPVFERVLTWMHSVLPLEKWFGLYIKLHLTMVFHKVARICMNQKPEWFTDDLEKLDKGIDMFGNIFGKFVSREYQVLQTKYFPSIREIYLAELMEYLRTYFDYRNFDYSKERFIVAFIESMLEESDYNVHILASFVFINHDKYYFKYGNDLKNIKKGLEQTNKDEVRFYLHIQSN